MNLDFISDERIKKQILFALEMDKLKQILRKTSILGKSRKENSAEHSWHLALIAILLAEYANESIDLLKTLKMILVHDIAEIEAGDTLVYHRSSSTSKKEDQAAQKIFSNLPSDQAKEFYMLWKEFEEGDSIEARFARAMDRMAPVLLNYANQGDTWREYSISHQQALKINDRIVEGSSQIWEIVKKLFSSAIEKGFLGKGN
ncbi:MAG: HD domain-containing protein [Verrucomicrobiota bacterium]